MKGWVYVISNEAMPGLVKVGFSTKDPELRAADFYHTGSPHPFIVDYEILVDAPRNVEQAVHERLKKYWERKEWFRCSPEEAVRAIKIEVGDDFYFESFKRAERSKVEEISRREADKSARLYAEKRNKIQSLVEERKQIETRYAPLLREARRKYEEKSKKNSAVAWVGNLSTAALMGLLVLFVLFPVIGAAFFVALLIAATVSFVFTGIWGEMSDSGGSELDDLLKNRSDELAKVDEQIERVRSDI